MVAVYYMDQLAPQIPPSSQADTVIWQDTSVFEVDHRVACNLCETLGKSLRDRTEFMDALAKAERWLLDTCDHFRTLSDATPVESQDLYETVMDHRPPES
jgi:hypothetical protein